VLGPHGYQSFRNAVDLLTFATPPADVVDITEGSRETVRGLFDADPTQTLLGLGSMAGGMAGMFVPGSVGGMKKMMTPDAPTGAARGVPLDSPASYPPTPIDVYHGSPHKFDKFDSAHIGTGEGQQVYSRGIYHGEAEGTAKTYRGDAEARYNRVTGGAMTGREALAYDLAMNGHSDNDIMMSLARSYGDDISFDEAQKLANDAISKKGHMYQNRLHMAPEEVIDWDMPIRDQSQTVRDFFGPEPPPMGMGTPALTGADMYNKMLRPGYGPAEFAEAARAAGIKGMKFKDQASRGLREGGTHNYVTYDDNVIQMMRRYGMLPLMGAGAAGAMYAGQQGLAPVPGL